MPYYQYVSYAYDVASIVPLLHGLTHMLRLCDEYAVENHITMNIL